MEWIGDHAWQVWAAAALLLAGAEMLSLDLVLVMIAVSALSGMIVAMVGGAWGIQVIAASATALALLMFVRPPMVRRLHAGPDLLVGAAALPGRTGYVEAEISAAGGRVKIGGEVWSALPAVENERIVAGERVEVVEIKGATAIVRPAHLEE
jgi:membrane protein implicated in regulation of membrane protease activity